MARRFVLIDDHDGKELPEDTAPLRLAVGKTTYNLYLSDANQEKLMKALEPFITGAETVEPMRLTPSRTAPKSDKNKLKAVREWAQATGYKFKGADGELRTLGDRGRIPDEVVKAYEDANE